MEYLFEISHFAILPLGVLCIMLRRLWGKASAKEYFFIAKIFILISMAMLVWNQGGVFSDYFTADILTAIAYILTSVAFLVWLTLSLKWFTTEKLPACSFCASALLLLFGFNLLLYAKRLDIMLAAVAVLALMQYSLLRFSQENEEFHNISGCYGFSLLFFVLMAAVAVIMLYPHGLSYVNAAEQIAKMPDILLFLTASGLLLVFIFMLGIAPLHFWTSDVAGLAVLPVAAYFAFVPQTALWVSFIKINMLLFAPLAENLKNIYLTFGVLSLIIGAFGANTSRNMRRIFSFAGLLNLGIMLILVAPFKAENVAAGLGYMQIYTLIMSGVYTVIFAFKRNGEYLSNLNMLNGAAKNKPFIAVALLFFMLALMLISPLPMFFSVWNTLNYLVFNEQYLVMAAVIVAIIIILPAFMQIFRTVFFASASVNIDRVEPVIYVLLMLNLLLSLSIMFYPEILFNEALWLISGVK
jgi:NADH:ubiquinone oxidoreductase subunit 2 (subunit N)